MRRRAFLGALGTSFFVMYPTLVLTDEPSKSAVSWHRLTQRERNLKIVSAALFHNGKIGGECKEWVRKVVGSASGGHVAIPPNAAVIASAWTADATGHVVRRSVGIEKVAFGEIVQMIIRARNGNAIGHTAIVGSNNSGVITWLESNYRGDNKVTSDRTQRHSEFYNSLTGAGQFSIYSIL